MYIPIADYAALHGKSADAARHKYSRGYLAGYRKGGAWYVDDRTPWVDWRKYPWRGQREVMRGTNPRKRIKVVREINP